MALVVPHLVGTDLHGARASSPAVLTRVIADLTGIHRITEIIATITLRRTEPVPRGAAVGLVTAPVLRVERVADVAPRAPRVADVTGAALLTPQAPRVAQVPRAAGVARVPRATTIAQVTTGVAGVARFAKITGIAKIAGVTRVAKIPGVAKIAGVARVAKIAGIARVAKIPGVTRVAKIAGARGVAHVARGAGATRSARGEAIGGSTGITRIAAIAEVAAIAQVTRIPAVTRIARVPAGGPVIAIVPPAVPLVAPTRPPVAALVPPTVTASGARPAGTVAGTSGAVVRAPAEALTAVVTAGRRLLVVARRRPVSAVVVTARVGRTLIAVVSAAAPVRSASPQLRARRGVDDREVGLVEVDAELGPVEVDVVEVVADEVVDGGVDGLEVGVVEPAGPFLVEGGLLLAEVAVVGSAGAPAGRHDRVRDGAFGVVLLLLDRGTRHERVLVVLVRPVLVVFEAHDAAPNRLGKDPTPRSRIRATVLTLYHLRTPVPPPASRDQYLPRGGCGRLTTDLRSAPPPCGSPSSASRPARER
ncbi:hypothetical protein [Actinoplanes philippinensis]|uniref:hypothetical protein n=1 Tax=Actinoplanes philippinensis TaxID=35752 RepID=UPI00116035DE|nr:hypothetical protein [Actinoplanes philippinensis]